MKIQNLTKINNIINKFINNKHNLGKTIYQIIDPTAPMWAQKTLYVTKKYTKACKWYNKNIVNDHDIIIVEYTAVANEDTVSSAPLTLTKVQTW